MLSNKKKSKTYNMPKDKTPATAILTLLFRCTVQIIGTGNKVNVRSVKIAIPGL